MQYQLMKTQTYAVLLLALFVLSGCASVKYVADYDKAVLEGTFSLAKQVDTFWANYLVASGDDRKYESVKKEIIDIEVNMNSLLLKNEARDTNKQTTKQIENIIFIWGNTAGLIKSQGSISNSSAKTYRSQIADAFKYVVTGEEAKNISNNATNN
jgi:uncharacterized protein YcfL